MTALLYAWVVGAISAVGYGGVIALMTLESACIPIPSEIIMTFSGYLVSTGRFDLPLVATAGALGNNIGATIAYFVGSYGGRPAVLRWGRYVLFGADELHRMERMFQRFGGAAVFIGRLLPAVRTFISLPAGIAKMPLLRFQFYTFIGSWPWCFVLAYLGMILGRQWHNNPILQEYFKRFQWLVILAVVLAVACYIYSRWRAARRASAER
jgi:membrane protein DedA with SNARE-associated domain